LILVTRPRYDDELGQAEDVLPTAPTGYFGEGIRTDDEEQALAGRVQFLDGVDGVAFFVAIFEARWLKAGVGSASKFHHAVTVFIAGSGGFQLVRRIRCRNEEHSLERELIRGLASHCEMRAMDGVESSAEDCSSQVYIVVG
jgi:hypothetical protein